MIAFSVITAVISLRLPTLDPYGFRRCFVVMSVETSNQQSCGGKKRAMLAYGLV